MPLLKPIELPDSTARGYRLNLIDVSNKLEEQRTIVVDAAPSLVPVRKRRLLAISASDYADHLSLKLADCLDTVSPPIVTEEVYLAISPASPTKTSRRT